MDLQTIEMPRGVLVKTYPRIHITLIDLARATSRRFGGAGFSVDTLPATVEARLSFENRIISSSNLRYRDQRDAVAYLDSLSRALNSHFEVKLKDVPPQHIGLGSKTTILLAIGIACNSLIGKALSRKTLAKLSRRGGASGIGINSAFKGGFIVDGGHGMVQGKEFVPSSASKPGDLPPILVRLPFPEHWRVHLFVPSSGTRYSGDSELQFFRENTPIPASEVFHVMAAVYHGIAPAIAEADHSLLKQAILEVHQMGFKRREVHAQGPAIGQILETLNGEGHVVAGMSSMGPLVYAIENREGELCESKSIAGLRVSEDIGYHYECRGRNLPYELGWV